MPTDRDAALSAAIDERDRLHHELGQVVRDLSGHDDPEVMRVVDRARITLELIAPSDDAGEAVPGAPGAV